MKTSQKEIKQYANAVSNDIFRKPLSELIKPESVTLRLSLILRLNNDEIDAYTYQQVDSYVKQIVFQEPKHKPKQKNEPVIHVYSNPVSDETEIEDFKEE